MTNKALIEHFFVQERAGRKINFHDMGHCHFDRCLRSHRLPPRHGRLSHCPVPHRSARARCSSAVALLAPNQNLAAQTWHTVGQHLNLAGRN